MTRTQPGRLAELAISDTGFIFDPYSGATYNVNATGLVLLKGLRVGKGRAALVAALAEEFEVESHDLERDLDDFIQVLRQRNLVPSDFTLEGSAS